MKIDNYTYPKSSFLSVEKDLSIIVDRIMKNKRLQRLLYYTTPDALDRPNLNQEQLVELLSTNIRLVPQILVDGTIKNYVNIVLDDFTTNNNNPEFRDNIIEFDIVCEYDQWNLKDFQSRPFKIAAELDSMFNNTRLTGIGKLQFMGAAQLMFNKDYGGICMLFEAIHGEEDKKKIPNPIDEKQFLKDFEDYIKAE